MATYVVLVDRTGGMLDQLEQAPMEYEEAVAALKAAGGEVVVMVATEATHDAVVVVRAPDDATAEAFASGLGSPDGFKATTLRGSEVGDVRHIVGREVQGDEGGGVSAGGG